MTSCYVHDHLGEQRIETRVYAQTTAPTSVDPHSRAGRRIKSAEGACCRSNRPVGRHVFGIDAQLQRNAAYRWLFALHKSDVFQATTSRDVELRAHQVDAGYFFGYRVLDLQTGVGLDESKFGLPGCVLPDQEFKGREVAQANRPCHAHRCFN